MEMTLLFFYVSRMLSSEVLGGKTFLGSSHLLYFSGGGCICCPSCVEWWWSKMTVMYRCTVRKKRFFKKVRFMEKYLSTVKNTSLKKVFEIK